MNDVRSWSDDATVRFPLLAAAVLGLPLMAFVVLRLFPQLDLAFGAHTWHFVLVSIVAAVAFALALAVAWAARLLPDPRTFFLAMAFLAMAGIFLAHGLGTAPFFGAQHEGMTMPMDSSQASGMAMGSNGYAASDYGPAPVSAPQNVASSYDDGYAGGSYGSSGASGQAGRPSSGGGVSTDSARLQVVGFSAQLSLMVSAVFFALAVSGVGRRLGHFVVRHWTVGTTLVLLALAAYMTIALAFPAALLWIPLAWSPLNWAVAGVAWCCFGFAGWRFLQAYRLSLLPLQSTMALSMGLLIEAQVFVLVGPVWHLSWWEYHVVMLVAFVGAVAGLLCQYRAAGDLGAVVEGLFLREAVTGLRTGDPNALSLLSAAVAAKDGETSAHVERVARLAVAIGAQLGLPSTTLEVVRWGALLHDLGKIGVANSLLLKPAGLTEAEYELVKRHSVRGWQIAMRSGILSQAAPAIRGHHERWDGSGYPDGLVGESIPLEARIIAVADVWDALTSDRPYRQAMRSDDARAIILRDTGVLLDRRCVNALFAVPHQGQREAAATR